MTGRTLRIELSAVALGLAFFASPAAAQLRVLHPSDAPFTPNRMGVASSAPLAAAGPTDPYALVVRFAKDQRAPLHTHPDTRIVTVLKGMLVMGNAEGKTIDINAGMVVLIPAGTPHSGWARDGAAEIVETGTGATATDMVVVKR